MRSSYKRETKNPRTGKFEMADWLDDLFGHLNYGVVFDSDREHFGRDLPLKTVAVDPRKFKLETR